MLREDMKVIDIVYRYPHTEAVFKRYDSRLGGCVMCSHIFDTLNELTKRYDFDLAQLIKELEEAAADSPGIIKQGERIDASEQNC